MLLICSGVSIRRQQPRFSSATPRYERSSLGPISYAGLIGLLKHASLRTCCAPMDKNLMGFPQLLRTCNHDQLHTWIKSSWGTPIVESWQGRCPNPNLNFPRGWRNYSNLGTSVGRSYLSHSNLGNSKKIRRTSNLGTSHLVTGTWLLEGLVHRWCACA